MSTMIFTEKDIIELSKTDAELVRVAFEHGGEKMGAIAIKSAINDFKTLLSLKKDIVAYNMDVDYRTYIINFLKYAIEISPENVKSAIAHDIIFG